MSVGLGNFLSGLHEEVEGISRFTRNIHSWLRYRGAMWVEKGVGKAELLLRRRSGKVRFILRQKKQAKIVAELHVPYASC